MTDPERAIDTINARFGRHPRRRALHAKGSWARGVFTATPAAASLCRAAHFSGAPIPVLARLSNGSGNPDAPDAAPDVRGLALSLELPDGSRTDMVSQSVPRFFSRTPDEFLDFVRAAGGPRLPLFLATHPKALLALPVNGAALRPLPSYANCRFYGVHAFRWLDAGGDGRHVRWQWRPEAGEERIGPLDARRRGRDYLQNDLAERLARGEPVRWVLDVQIAEPGDPVDDPSAAWPSNRRRVDAGALELTETVPDPETDGGIVVFDPVRVTDGIELTADPVLNFRPRAYSVSADRRS